MLILRSFRDPNNERNKPSFLYCDTENNVRNCFEMENAVIHSKDADGMANNVDPDQTGP